MFDELRIDRVSPRPRATLHGMRNFSTVIVRRNIAANLWLVE